MITLHLGMNISDFLSYLGTFVFAITGAMKARTHKMDLIGGLVLAFVTAYGGGTLRDLIIGIRPVNPLYGNVIVSLNIILLLAARFESTCSRWCSSITCR